MAPAPAGTLGRTAVGGLSAAGGSGFIAVSGSYTLAAAASTTELVGYLRGGTTAQPARGVIYADNGSGAPGSFVAASQQVTVAAGAAAGWVSFPFASSVSLPAGRYWLGYWFGGSGILIVSYESVAGSGRYVDASYSAAGNPPAGFGGGTGDSIALSLYATLTGSGGGGGVPVNTSVPTLSPETLPAGGPVTAEPGSWTNSPTGFSYQWQTCDDDGQNCVNSGAATSSPTFVTNEEHSIRVVVTATKRGRRKQRRLGGQVHRGDVQPGLFSVLFLLLGQSGRRRTVQRPRDPRQPDFLVRSPPAHRHLRMEALRRR